jgi:hypothetical protein
VIEVPTDGAVEQEHTVLLAGMRAESSYTVDVAVVVDDCELREAVTGLTLTTGALPDTIPEIVVTERDPEAMAPGVTLFDLIGLAQEDDPPADPAPRGWLVMVDDAGEVVWYHAEDHAIGDARMLDDGTILFEYNDTAARRIDLRGDVLEEWAGTLITGRFALDRYGRRVVGDDPLIVDVEAMHHEHHPLPDGTRAVLSTEIVVYDGFSEPICDEDPATFDGTYHLVTDIVVLFDPETGEVLERFPLADYFDPRDDPVAYNLCGLPFPQVFPNWLYAPIDPLVRDWTHANAIEVDEPNNTLIVSIRHLDALIGIRWKDDGAGPAGELLWHSGPLGDLELVSGEWHRHQHAPEVQEDGTVLVYDNGNQRPGRGTPDAPFYSRAVRYRIDPEAGTVEQLWEYVSNRDGALVFAGFVGDADHLDNGNVLITDGGINSDEGDRVSAQLAEVDPAPTEGGEVVWAIEVRGGAAWVVYRAERVPSPFGVG